MSPFQLIKIAWQDTRTRILFPGILLCLGSGIALIPTTGGRMVCDQGMCVQEQTAAFGTVRDAVMYPTTEINDFRIERGRDGAMTRVVIDLKGISKPLTAAFSLNHREVERITSEGQRFIAEGATARFVAALEVSGIQSFFRPLALLFLILGAALTGWVIRSTPREHLPF